jgi:transposase InsO family protein
MAATAATIWSTLAAGKNQAKRRFTRRTLTSSTVEGSATFVTGGEAVDAKTTAPDELRGSSIRNEETRKIAAPRIEDNETRPHSSLGYRTPKEFATAMKAAEAGSALLATPSSAANPDAGNVV